LTSDDEKKIDLAAERVPVLFSIQDLFETSIQANSQYENTKKGRSRIFIRMANIVNKYSKAVDVFIQQQPDITAVVWGSVRFLIQVRCGSQGGKLID
jgi:hypothetical protein